jgi:hypothetical protein
MKRPEPTKRGFTLSIATITKHEYDTNYEYALWSKGFECAVRKMAKINKSSPSKV